jgi:tetratricopeptide (TPR) repeat protein
MKFIDDAGLLARKSSGICLLVAGAALTACSTVKNAPTPAAVAEVPAPTAEEISSEPDLEKMARERAAKGEVKSKEAEGKTTAAGADTSRGPEMAAPLDETQKTLARSLQPDYDRALGLMKSGQAEEAYALFDEIQGKAPAFTGPSLNQALIRLQQKNPAEALLLLKKTIGINDKSPYAWSLTGYTEKQLGHFKAAREAYEKALALSPKYGKAHFNLAVLCDLYLLDLPAALQHYEAYQALQAQADPTVAKWIIDLQKRTGVYKPPAKKAVSEEITEEPSPGAEKPATTPEGGTTEPSSATPTPATATTETPAAPAPVTAPPVEQAPATTPAAEGTKP